MNHICLVNEVVQNYWTDCYCFVLKLFSSHRHNNNTTFTFNCTLYFAFCSLTVPNLRRRLCSTDIICLHARFPLDRNKLRHPSTLQPTAQSVAGIYKPIRSILLSIVIDLSRMGQNLPESYDSTNPSRSNGNQALENEKMSETMKIQKALELLTQMQLIICIVHKILIEK